MNMARTQRSLRLIIGLVLTLSVALGRVTPASAAQRCYVKAGASGTGTSWADAIGNPQQALANAACTEIWVAKGTYQPTKGTDRTISFVLKNGVALYGGFNGTETLLTQRNPARNATILSGEIGAAGIGDNSYHVVKGNSTDNTARLDGFTVTGGNANDNSPNDVGGGMYTLFSGSPTVANVTFSGNSATGGAGMFNDGSSPSLTNVTFSGNMASSSGGGMWNYNLSNPTLSNVTFSGNSAVNVGGAMYNFQSLPILTNATFSGNSAASGGAFYNEFGSSPTVTNSILYGDTGGEIVHNSSGATVTYSIVQGGYVGTNNLDVNPRLKPLANYGGFTKTMPLGYGSPAIDAGTNVGCPPADQRGIARPQDGDLNGISTCDMGATESRLFAKSFPSLASQDGYVLESTETSGTGGSLNSTEQILKVGDSTARQQGRSILSFNTATLPDTVQVVSAVLRLKQAAISSPSPFSLLGSLLVDVRKGPFGNNPALQLADFEAPASKLAATTIPFSVTGVYVKAIPAASFAYINKLGLTQFRLRFSLDDNNDNISNYIRFYSGNATIASNRPVLAVKYYMP